MTIGASLDRGGGRMIEYWMAFDDDGNPQAVYRIVSEETKRFKGEHYDLAKNTWEPSHTIDKYIYFGEIGYEKVAEGDALRFIRENSRKSDRGPDQRRQIGAKIYDAAVDLTEAGQPEMAEAAFRMAIELDPDDYQSRNNLAVILDKSGRAAEAEKLYLEAAGHPFYDASAMFNLGYLHARTGRNNTAEIWYRRAIATDERKHEAMVNLAGLVQQDQSRRREAKSLLESALRVEPDDSIALFELANIHRLDGEQFLAEMFYRKAVLADPRGVLANFNLGLFLQEIGREREAQPYLDLARQLDVNGVLEGGQE